jgi:hypothetical protein
MKLLVAAALALLAGVQTKPAGSPNVSPALNFTMDSIDGSFGGRRLELRKILD